MTEQPAGDALTETIRVDTGPLQGHIAAVVRSSVEETLNGLLEAETICRASCGAGRHPGRTLSAEAGDEGRPRDAEDAETAAVAI